MAKKSGSKRPGKSPPLKVVGRNGSLRPARNKKGTNGGNPPDGSGPVDFPVVVEFVRGSPTPGPESLKHMYQCARWLARHRRECVTVVGHANDRGWTRAARALARARVAAVSDLLVLLGAKPAQLIPISAARLHSVPAGSTLGERRQHRVVVIYHHESTKTRLRSALRRATGR
ncbi:MAG: OmpA family protein [Gammaproteobacteria bacterium]|nr:OmpA family protein [Gammaproteobacteria bacterium]